MTKENLNYLTLFYQAVWFTLVFTMMSLEILILLQFDVLY